MTLFLFNSLLRKLDNDAQISYSSFSTTFEATKGCNLKTLLQGLAAQLDSSITPTPAPTYVSVLSGGTTLTDIKNDYNAIVNKLNNDAGVASSTYQLAIEQTFEAVIVSIDTKKKELTLNYSPPFYIGAITFFESIECEFTYAPVTMGDPINWKHVREATLMLENRSITRIELAFSSDLLPEYKTIDFLLDGNGIFGTNTFGNGFFGGASNSAPVRTIIPRQVQRCRYILARFKHKVAREKYSVYGMTLSGEVLESVRAYR